MRSHRWWTGARVAAAKMGSLQPWRFPAFWRRMRSTRKSNSSSNLRAAKGNRKAVELDKGNHNLVGAVQVVGISSSLRQRLDSLDRMLMMPNCLHPDSGAEQKKMSSKQAQVHARKNLKMRKRGRLGVPRQMKTIRQEKRSMRKSLKMRVRRRV